MADETVTEGAAQTATETQVTSPLQTELDAAKAENSRLQLEFEQARHVNQRQRNEIDEKRRQFETLRGQLAQEGYEEPKQSQESILKERQDLQDERIGMMEYKQDNPEWKEHWGEMQKIFQDPTKAEEIAVFGRDGRADWKKTMVNAQTRVEIQQLRQLKSETQAAKATRATGQELQKGQATISGVSASAAEESVDVSKMTSDEMLRAGLVDMDPRDPAKERHPKE